MKIKITVLAMIFAIANGFAQEVRETEDFNRFRVQTYVGGPSLMKTAVNFSNNFQDKITWKGTPLIGGEFDYRFAEWFSLGADVAVRSGKLQFDILDSTFFQEIDDKWNVDVSEFVDPFGHYEMKLVRTKVMVKANFHVLPAESRSDLYFTAGIGYNNLKSNLTLDGERVPFFNKVGKISLPVAYRTSIGYSYNFTENVGLFGEVGLGGPIVSGGLNIKF